MKLTKSDYTYISMWAKKVKAIKLLGSKCIMCGESNMFVLDFHHKNPKEKQYNINDLKDGRWSIMEKELQKCNLVCANCHRELHSSLNKTVEQHNKLIFLEFKQVFSCQCGYNRCNNALDFHHSKANKNFTVGCAHRDNKLRARIKTVADLSNILKDELNKCDVLCANCHRLETIDVDKFDKFKHLIYNKIQTYKELQPKIDRTKIKELYDTGLSKTQIARELKCAKSTITYALKCDHSSIGGAPHCQCEG